MDFKLLFLIYYTLATLVAFVALMVIPMNDRGVNRGVVFNVFGSLVVALILGWLGWPFMIGMARKYRRGEWMEEDTEPNDPENKLNLTRRL